MGTMRFETYLAGQDVDPRARARLYGSTMIAMAAIALGGTAMWTADHLGIKPVPPPASNVALLVELGDPPPPPQAAPPPRPSAGAAATVDDDDDVSDRRRPTADVAELDADPLPIKKTGTGPRTPGVPGDVGTGPTPSACLVPPCIGTSPFGTGPSFGAPPNRTPKAPDDRVLSPIASVRANAIYSPDPDAKKLAATAAGTLHRRPGASEVTFCVDGSGKVVDVRTKKKFGDPDVDRICREAVSAWRFKPFTVGGTPKKTCSSVTFQLRFD